MILLGFVIADSVTSSEPLFPGNPAMTVAAGAVVMLLGIYIEAKKKGWKL